jgi:branched-chain amino acid transport system permease protein
MFYYVILTAQHGPDACHILLYSQSDIFGGRSARTNGCAGRPASIRSLLQDARWCFRRYDIVRTVFYAFFTTTHFPKGLPRTALNQLIIADHWRDRYVIRPDLGAFVLTGLAEGLTAILAALGVDLPGAKQVFYGFCLLFVIVAVPDGIWPWLARRLCLSEPKQ